MQNVTNYFSRTVVLGVLILFGRYNSSSPSILLAPGVETAVQYKGSEYLSIIIRERLGQGAIGEVFRATIQPERTNSPEYCPVIVKLATSLKRMCRLRHEYSIYMHLEAQDIEGVPRLLGYYQDASQNVAALILHDLGRPLAERRDLSKGLVVTTKEK